MKETKNDVVNYSYYSKLLNKPFDSLDELTEAEDAERAAQEAKKKASEAKKCEAHKVEKAFKDANAAKRDYSESLMAARKTCAKAIADAKAKYSAAVTAADEQLVKAENAYEEALKEFTDKHPEGYHVTLKDGDTVTTIDTNPHSELLSKMDKLFF